MVSGQPIAEYLSRARAVRCTPEQGIVLNGSQQAFDLAARVLLDPGSEKDITEGIRRLASVLRAITPSRV